ncbi:hypothetical protein [Yoonia vestfoldensis]|uniref:Uncharacterized protein n=1 Tax=Yoonia vestfoldensis SKA53 TaxID=314232 RepID=A3V1R5_9RHOB|nr:hypothetical protein [Yoonia vestfoldensis]EAQ08168.1 hypothetical protein SKA53_10599 [Yoonia vestfoldensis SKA53]
MNDILVPADPADLIDRIVDLQLRLDAADDPVLQTELRRQHGLLSRLADRIMPPDDVLADLIQQLGDARRDQMTLIKDLQNCDASKEYGIAFVALSQALLATIASAAEARTGINQCYARHVAGSVTGVLRDS